MNEQMKEMQEELEEMAMQLADMLEVALYYAGVKKDKLQEAIDTYLDILDEDDESEYGFSEIVFAIEDMKKKHKDLFK